MMAHKTMGSEEYSDAELVSRSLAGDRDAFSRIVSRYQTLICSLAFSRLGNLGQSEDVAQETFITAWKHLRLLREPVKLRAWLCGIVRNRIYKHLRREGREPAHNAESLDLVHDTPAEAGLPSEHAVTREEEALLWRSLERIPETYREPLILFYREHQSIGTVAAELELSEDAVKQRLSRGRKLLQEELQAFVEKTLYRSSPSQAFSGAVLAALPAGPVTATIAGAAGKSAAAVKSGLLGAWLGPILGILAGVGAHWLIVRAAPTARERRLKRIMFIALWCFVVTWCVPGLAAMRALGRHLQWSDATYFQVMAGFWWLYAVVLATLSVVMLRRIAAIRRESEATGTRLSSTSNPLGVGAGLALILGVHLAYFSWLIGLALAAHDRASAGLLVGVMLALALLNMVRLGNQTGMDAVRAIARHQALLWGSILVILNWRLGTWVATLNHLERAAVHRLLPMWIIPLLSVALVAWICLLLIATRSLMAADKPNATS